MTYLCVINIKVEPGALLFAVKAVTTDGSRTATDSEGVKVQVKWHVAPGHGE